MIPERFDEFYRAFWGDRWPALRAALDQPENQVKRPNLWATPSSEAAAGESRQIPRGENGLLLHYVMDPASIWVAESLGVRAGETVLDLCAAPGGKTLVLIEQLFRDGLGEGGELTANESSPERRQRLTKVIQQYVPRDVRDRVWVSGRDGLTFGRNPTKFFDRILADVPCSGERHLLKNPTEMANWGPKRSEGLMKKQYGLLTAAFESLADGGMIAYSTCSLSHLENEEVIRRFLKKRADRARLVPIPNRPEIAEEWEFGLQVLPDKSAAGPLRWCLLQKT